MVEDANQSETQGAAALSFLGEMHHPRGRILLRCFSAAQGQISSPLLLQSYSKWKQFLTEAVSYRDNFDSVSMAKEPLVSEVPVLWDICIQYPWYREQSGYKISMLNLSPKR